MFHSLSPHSQSIFHSQFYRVFDIDFEQINVFTNENEEEGAKHAPRRKRNTGEKKCFNMYWISMCGNLGQMPQRSKTRTLSKADHYVLDFG